MAATRREPFARDVCGRVPADRVAAHRASRASIRSYTPTAVPPPTMTVAKARASRTIGVTGAPLGASERASGSGLCGFRRPCPAGDG